MIIYQPLVNRDFIKSFSSTEEVDPASTTPNTLYN